MSSTKRYGQSLHRKTTASLMGGLVVALFLMGCEHQNPVVLDNDEMEDSPNSENSTTGNSENNESVVVQSTDFSVDITGALAKNCSSHADDNDYTCEGTDITIIQLTGTSATVDGDGVTIEGNRVTITDAGCYRLTGTLVDGQITVDAEDSKVRLILDGASVTNTSGAPLYVKSADKAIIILASSSDNTFIDGSNYLVTDNADSAINAAIFSKSDLSFSGTGSLTVHGNYGDGITSKDGLVIANGTFHVTATDDGIRGKDYLIITGGTITVNATGDGLKSDNDSTKGYIYIESATINCTAGADAIAAQTDILIASGIFTLNSGKGNAISSLDTTSRKGIKGNVNTIIAGGTFSITSSDDAIHTNGNLVINGGTFDISSNDDAMHADSTLIINQGTINIITSYEGIESKNITINDGTIHLVASDDGINGSDGSGGGEMGMTVMGETGGPSGSRSSGSMSDFGGGTMGGSGSCTLSIHGGYIAVNATGDGVDINGSIVMTGGTLVVNGPTESANGPLDYDGSFTMSGGLLLAAGSSGMAQAPGATSTQYVALATFSSTQNANTIIHLQSSDGTEIFSFAPLKRFQSLAFSTSELAKDKKYIMYIGGSSTGTPADGLYKNGTYSPGTKYAEFTISDIVTTIR